MYFEVGLLICMVEVSLTETMSLEFSTPKLLDKHDWAFYPLSGLFIVVVIPISSVTEVDVTAVFAAWGFLILGSSYVTTFFFLGLIFSISI